MCIVLGTDCCLLSHIRPVFILPLSLPDVTSLAISVRPLPSRAFDMVMGWVFTGAAFGFTTQMYTNALRQLPLTRYPWEYLIWTAGGAWGGYFMSGAVARARARVAEIEATRGELAKGPPRDILDQQ